MFFRLLAGMLLLITASSAYGTEITSGNQFSVTKNPIISYQRGHYSSDPAVAVIDGYKKQPGDPARNLLVMLTSTDLSDVEAPLEGDEWPMNGTRLYATFGENSLQTTWYEYGNVIVEDNFQSWVKPGTNRMFAPDILHVQGSPSSLYLYIPDVDQFNTINVNDKTFNIRRVGVAHAPTPGGTTLYTDPFIAENHGRQSYFRIDGNPPNKGYAFDPGVFYAEDVIDGQTMKGYFMVYADAHYEFNQHINVSMVSINSDPASPDYMKAGNYLGRIRFATYSKYNGLDHYYEGPDVYTMTTRSRNKYYYLIFSAAVEKDQTGYIGYAMADPDEFWRAPLSSWKFKGWIFRNQYSGVSNHATLANFDGHHYVLFHRTTPNKFFPEDLSHARQVCAKEIELVDHPGFDDDGEIVGVTRAPDTDQDRNKSELYGTLDGLTKSVGKGFIDVKDEARSDGYTAKIRLSSLQNPTTEYLSKFYLYYYLDIEPGCNLTVELNKGITTPTNFILPQPYLKHLGAGTWAVILEYRGPSLDPGAKSPYDGDLLVLRYDQNSSPCAPKNIWGATQPAPFEKSNDFSEPVGNYKVRTTRVALMATDGRLLAGEAPEIAAPKFLRTAAIDADGKFTYATITSTDRDKGINSQYLGSNQKNASWLVEDASQFIGLSSVDKPNAIRLRNVSTGNYLTGNNDNQNPSGQPYYKILGQALRPEWNTPIWVTQDAGNGSVSLRSIWKNNPADADLFLTRSMLPNSNSDRGTKDIYNQPSDSSNRQKWFLEDVPTVRLLRSNVPSITGNYTYLTAITSSENEGINNQNLNTGWTSQVWVVEDARNFTGYNSLTAVEKANAIRLKNVWTGYYMTSNHINKATGTEPPTYWLLDQGLHTDWNTQVWIKEDGGNGLFRLRTVFRDIEHFPNAPLTLYLTRDEATDSNGKQNVYVEEAKSGKWPYQLWSIE